MVTEPFPDFSVVDPVVAIFVGLAETVNVWLTELTFCAADDMEVGDSVVVISRAVGDIFAVVVDAI